MSDSTMAALATSNPGAARIVEAGVEHTGLAEAAADEGRGWCCGAVERIRRCTPHVDANAENGSVPGDPGRGPPPGRCPRRRWRT
ncbi:MAG: hypothetical protein ACLP9Y_21820 [Mycobacterium sp.]